MRELLDALCQNRKRLALVYLISLASWMALILYDPIAMIAPEAFTHSEGLTMDQISLRAKLVIFVIFFVLQAAFLFGGGKIRVQPGRTPMRRMFISVFVFAAVMAVLGCGFIWTYLQLTGRIPAGNRQATGVDQFDPAKLADAMDSVQPSAKAFVRRLLWIISGLWLWWFIIGIVATRRTDQLSGISRLVGCLLAGSWIEFAVALSVETVTRERDKSCPCASGSWVALIFCAPILVWSIGPAIYLLFLREKSYCERDRRHSRYILLEKSMRAPKREASA